MTIVAPAGHAPAASASSHAPRVRFTWPKRFMQGSCPDPGGFIKDRDGDLRSVRIYWADGEGDKTIWRAPAPGAVRMPWGLDTLNQPCFNHTGRYTLHVHATDWAGHRTHVKRSFSIYPDPEWPGPEVPVCELRPGQDCTITIGVG